MLQTIVNSFSPEAFAQRVVVVTGGAQGIGLSICRAFARCGATVILSDVQSEMAQQQAAIIAREGGRVSPQICDVAKAEQIQTLIDTTLSEWGRVDVVVHNAAYFPLTPLAQITEACLQKTLAINLMAPFFLAQAVSPLMQKQGFGRILVTSSVTGPRVAYPGLAHYAASKAGVNGFIRAAALELAPWGITVNGVEPGMIRTPAMGNLGDNDLSSRIGARIPLGRLGEGEDIAAAMLFLASEAAGYITGQTLVVDGGALLPEVTLQ